MILALLFFINCYICKSLTLVRGCYWLSLSRNQLTTYRFVLSMKCCTSIKRVITSRNPPLPAPLSKPEEYHREDVPVEIVHSVDQVIRIEDEPYRVVPVLSSERNYHMEPETLTDIESAFLIASPSLIEPIYTREKFARALYVSGRHPSKKRLNMLWKEFSDEEGVVDFRAFKDICKEEPLPSKDDFYRLFETLDRSRSGYINLKEMEHTLTTQGEKLTKDEFRQLIRLLNLSPDGEFRYQDFCDNIIHTSEECRDSSRKVRDYRLRHPAPTITAGPRTSNMVSSYNERNISREREVSEQQQALQQQLNKRYPEFFTKILDPTHAIRSKIPRLDDWTEMNSKGYFILDDPAKGGFITPVYSLILKRESRIYANLDVNRSQRLHERLHRLDIGMYIVSEPSDKTIGQIHMSEFGFGEAEGVCTLPPGKYLLLPHTTGCILKGDPVAKKLAEQRSRAPKMLTSTGKLSKELVDCIEDIFRLFDLDGDGYLSKKEFISYFRNSEDTTKDIDDSEWKAILDRYEAEENKLSFSNFTKLFEMELDEAEGDVDDILIGLHNLGINKSLIMDEACAYSVQVMVESPDAGVRFFVDDEMSSMTGPIREAVVAETINEGVELPNRKLADIGAAAYVYSDERHVKVTIANKSKSRIQLRLDASDSASCVFSTSSGSLRSKDGNSAGGIRSIVTGTVSGNNAVPLLFGVPTHPEKIAEFVLTSIDLIQ